MGSLRYRKQRERFWRNDPHCYWCGRLTQLLNIGPKPKYVPSDLATIDHLHHSYSSLRRQGKGKHVLACWECNNKRGHQDVQQYIEIHRIRSRAPASQKSHCLAAIQLESALRTHKRLWRRVQKYRANVIRTFGRLPKSQATIK